MILKNTLFLDYKGKRLGRLWTKQTINGHTADCVDVIACPQPVNRLWTLCFVFCLSVQANFKNHFTKHLNDLLWGFSGLFHKLTNTKNQNF